jgi:hypothetical protein
MGGGGGGGGGRGRGRGRGDRRGLLRRRGARLLQRRWRCRWRLGFFARELAVEDVDVVGPEQRGVDARRRPDEHDRTGLHVAHDVRSDGEDRIVALLPGGERLELRLAHLPAARTEIAALVALAPDDEAGVGGHRLQPGDDQPRMAERLFWIGFGPDADRHQDVPLSAAQLPLRKRASI